ncbi:N(2)-fixation sustaining protein CowN [Desulfuromonas acetoxidans]|nr:N(2)-fixation sustaining protein CowN [Desulfuromonas acetoxidans]NVD25294.1 N(2)-fixation sustaining protein CowN [Desulfuromonas acetoxidans]NVE17302.1 N(2)-fixation sustaining protein CowN [Desulfuromonas acetoxidans]
MSKMTVTQEPDRYVSFEGIDCEGNSKLLMCMLKKHLEDPSKNNAFWEMFTDKLGKAERGETVNGIQIDELFLIHAYINNLQDFFEDHEDDVAMTLLKKIERECC